MARTERETATKAGPGVTEASDDQDTASMHAETSGAALGHDAEVRRGLADSDIDRQPIWKVRLRLFARTSRGNWRLFRRNWIGLAGLAVVVFYGVLALIHPYLLGTVWETSRYHPVYGYHAPTVEKVVVERVTDPSEQIDLFTAQLNVDPLANVGDVVTDTLQPAPPSSEHWLGTDPLGRDILSQLMYSARAAFAMAAVAAITTAIIATVVGSVAAYFGGLTDAGLMRLADFVLLLPLIPLFIVVTGLFTINLTILGLMVGLLSGFGATAIVLKSQALSIKVKPFIDAGKVAGGGSWHVVTRHIIPNVLPLSFLYMMFTVTEAITLESILSFFGLMDINMSWGIMLHTTSTAGYLLQGLQYWWLVMPAGLAVTFLAAAFFFVGRAMDEVVNPRLRGR